MDTEEILESTVTDRPATSSAFLKSCFLRSYLNFLDTNKSIFKNSKRHSLQYLMIFLFLYHLQMIMRIIDAFYWFRKITSHIFRSFSIV
jgi:hypothetical protein